MGAGQSSDRGSGTQEVKTSYYELLGVQRQATDEELKKAYRRKALELHPDRNYGNEQAATGLFAEVRAAYEVLSDPQERAWYDSHESAILRGDDVGDEEGVPTYENVRITTADDLARMLRKFNSGVELTDAPSGFFGFLRDTFAQLAKEEEIAASWDNDEAPEYPTFGHKDDSYDDVGKRFYSAWSNFSTVKNFSWKDKLRLSEAPDRWYRRRMEQENKKFRQDGIREFNDAVRSLVAFVRKRDPRYVPSTQTEAERQKTLRDAAAAQAARARAANAAKLDDAVPEWAKARDPEELEESEEEEVEEQILECVACNKTFKSERQWEAHEKSKKHQKAVYALQKQMRKDNAMLDLNGNSTPSGDATPDVDGEGSESFDEVGAELEDEPLTNGNDVQADDADAVDDREEPDGNVEGSKHQEITAADSRGQSTLAETESEPDEDSDYASPETVAARLGDTTLNDSTPASTAAGSDEDASQPTIPKMGKAAQKRAKKAASAAAGPEAEGSHKCAGCEAAFPTKSRLHQHLKDHPKHAALKPLPARGKGNKGKR